jgi:hypothetical protein
MRSNVSQPLRAGLTSDAPPALQMMEGRRDGLKPGRYTGKAKSTARIGCATNAKRDSSSKIRWMRQSTSTAQAEAFAGANAEEKVGLLRSE